MQFGKIFTSRVSTHNAPPTLGAEDLTVFDMRFSHIAGEAATLEIDCIYPKSGLLSGPRWLVVSIEVDGVETEFARGEIVGHPVALPGEPVTVEIVCRKPDHTDEIDALFDAFDEQIPGAVVPTGRRRRAEDFLASDPYVDPVTLSATLDPVTGSAEPVRDLVGLSGGDLGDVIDMQISISETPVTRVEIDCEAYFMERRARVVDLFAPGPGPHETLTPNALVDSMKSPAVDGSGFKFLGASLQTSESRQIYTLKKHEEVDPDTCVKTPPAFEEVPVHKVDGGRMDFLVTVEQPRRERITLVLDPLIQDIGGGEVVKESYSLGNVESSLATSTPYSFETESGFVTTKFARTIERDSAFTGGSGGARFVSLAATPILQALYARAADIAVRRAHCVELRLTAPASSAFGLTLRDRVRVIDNRFTGGAAVGKISSLEFNFGSSETAEISVSCPISRPNEPEPAPSQQLNGALAQLAPSLTLETIGGPPDSYTMNAIQRNPTLASDFIEGLTFENMATEQEAELSDFIVQQGNTNLQETDAPLERVRRSSLRIDLKDTDAQGTVDFGTYSTRLTPGALTLAKGILLS